MSHFLIHAARLQDAGITHLMVKLEVAKDGARMMRVTPHMPYSIATEFPVRTFELCGTDRLLEQLTDDMAYAEGGPTPEALDAAIKTHRAAADDLREWYANWLAMPPLADEDIAEAEESVTSESVERTVRWVKGVMRGLDIAKAREAMKASSAGNGGVLGTSEGQPE